MSKCENIKIPIWVFRHPQCFTKPTYVLGTGFDLYLYGCGFHRYGSGLDRADPCQTHVPPYPQSMQFKKPQERIRGKCAMKKESIQEPGGTAQMAQWVSERGMMQWGRWCSQMVQWVRWPSMTVQAGKQQDGTDSAAWCCSEGNGAQRETVTIRLNRTTISFFLYPFLWWRTRIYTCTPSSSAYSCVITLCKPLSLTPFLLSLTHCMTHSNPRPTRYLPIADIPRLPRNPWPRLHALVHWTTYP